jgi:putative transposase
MTSVLHSLLLTRRTLARSRAALHLEILALRHQLDVLQRTRPSRVRLAKTDRCLWVVLARLWTGWRTALVIVKPDDRHRLASTRLPPLVDLEERAPHGAPDRCV